MSPTEVEELSKFNELCGHWFMFNVTFNTDGLYQRVKIDKFTTNKQYDIYIQKRLWSTHTCLTY